MHAKYYTSIRRYPSLLGPRISFWDMLALFMMIGLSSMTFFIILLPFLPPSVLLLVAIAAGTAVTYLIRYSPPILRRARLAVVHRQIRSARNR